MSVTIVRYLHCDRCREPWDNAPNPTVSRNTGESVELQRKFAAKAGWRVGLPGGKDYCDECVWEMHHEVGGKLTTCTKAKA